MTKKTRTNLLGLTLCIASVSATVAAMQPIMRRVNAAAKSFADEKAESLEQARKQAEQRAFLRKIARDKEILRQVKAGYGDFEPLKQGSFCHSVANVFLLTNTGTSMIFAADVTCELEEPDIPCKFSLMWIIDKWVNGQWQQFQGPTCELGDLQIDCGSYYDSTIIVPIGNLPKGNTYLIWALVYEGGDANCNGIGALIDGDFQEYQN